MLESDWLSPTVRRSSIASEGQGPRSSRRSATVIDQRTGWWFAPTSIKVVARDEQGRILLCLNDRGQWELPGGWPAAGDTSIAEVAARELREETGLEMRAPPELVSVDLMVGGNHGPVVLVFLRAELVPGRTVMSDEHTELEFFLPGSLPAAVAGVYREAIARAALPAT
jgi:8-oxo-dGTP pyrophosphatase MutT (NUDIX family)